MWLCMSCQCWLNWRSLIICMKFFWKPDKLKECFDVLKWDCERMSPTYCIKRAHTLWFFCMHTRIYSINKGPCQSIMRKSCSLAIDRVWRGESAWSGVGFGGWTSEGACLGQEALDTPVYWIEIHSLFKGQGLGYGRAGAPSDQYQHCMAGLTPAFCHRKSHRSLFFSSFSSFLSFPIFSKGAQSFKRNNGVKGEPFVRSKYI